MVLLILFLLLFAFAIFYYSVGAWAAALMAFVVLVVVFGRWFLRVSEAKGDR